MDTTLNLNSSYSEKLPVLCLCSYGENVKHLQEFLSQLGHYKKDINGYFCVYTEKSVRDFQFQIGIPVNGIVERRTWQAINRLTTFLGLELSL
ncbi:Peptidoglycan-binding domain 1 protein [Gloeothece citriformis PCC 7424]|uniref:Peptidoglycan-binding domain 1 protein n=1 Tax=Gloeothece citriformis (strain PCC 7424) TaxID=65393 RepID=B7KIU9_GLOC7|nr:peptidoglycan-binding domain-containing protein [Gloeothece citriformis]ACK70785.1 Peptidoglycan-binding domain 1 protein [Gloeothece citriformis PCC 7424]